MQYLVGLLFRGPFWVQLAIAGAFVWLGVTLDQMAAEKLAERRALIGAAPPATVAIEDFARPAGARGPVEVSVRVQLALDHNTRLVRRTNGVKTGEDMMYVLMSPEAAEGERMVHGAVLLDPDQVEGFAEWAMARTAGFGAEGPILTLDGLVTSEGNSGHALKAMRENGLKPAPGLIFVEPFIAGRAATLAAVKAGDTPLSWFGYGFAALFGLLALVKFRRRRRAVPAAAAPAPAQARPVPAFASPAVAPPAPPLPAPALAFVQPDPGAAAFRTAAAPRPPEPAIRSGGGLEGGRGRLVALGMGAVLLAAAYGGVLPGGTMRSIPQVPLAAKAPAAMPAPEAAPVAEPAARTDVVPAPTPELVPAPRAVTALAEPTDAAPAVDADKPPAGFGQIPDSLRAALPMIGGVVGAMLAAGLIGLRLLRRPAPRFPNGGIDPFDRFAERVRAGGRC